MLGKLLKHEWRAVWKVPVLLIGILMITAVIAGGTFALPIWNSEWVGLPLSGVMLIMTFYFAMIAVSIGIMIYFAVRFYKNVFTDEGYLTNTLPVSPKHSVSSDLLPKSNGTDHHHCTIESSDQYHNQQAGAKALEPFHIG